MIRVTAQLIKAEDGSHLWSESYDRDLKGIFQLQDEIANAVVQQLKLKLLDFPSTRVSGTRNIEAYNLILQGNYFFDKLDKDNVAKAVEFYYKALTIDSTDARTWAALANAISRQAWQNYIDQNPGYEKARQAAIKAIALDSTLAAGHLELGDIKHYHDFDWKGAEESYRIALKLAPSDADVLTSLGSNKEALGRCREAEQFFRKALIYNPLKPIIYLDLGHALSCDSRYNEAIAVFNKILEINPQYQRAHMYIGRNYLMMGKAQQALAEMEKENMEIFKILGLALAYHALDRKKEADEKLKVFTETYGNDWNYLLAELHAFRGEKEKSFDVLENAIAKKDSWLVFLKVDPLLKNIRGDSRYDTILKKMNLTID
jgi:serine/threonine-protein kinase